MCSASLRRIDALPELRAALLAFRSSTANLPDLIAQHIDQLERRVDAARARVERDRQAALAQLATRREHDDDDDDAFAALRDAETRVEQISRLAARLDRARGRFAHQTSNWNSVSERIIPKAVQSLQQTFEHAKAYLSVQPPGRSGAGSGESSVQAHGHTPSSEAITHPSCALSSSDLPALPVGFEWFPIDSFVATDLPGMSDLAKGVTEVLMRRGIEILWNEVMPLLLSGASPDEQRARCERFDREHGRVDRRGFVHPESVVAVWDAFFCTATSNQVRIELSPTDGRATITNGRHRIHSARELGWHFIPAEVIRRREPRS